MRIVYLRFASLNKTFTSLQGNISIFKFPCADKSSMRSVFCNYVNRTSKTPINLATYIYSTKIEQFLLFMLFSNKGFTQPISMFVSLFRNNLFSEINRAFRERSLLKSESEDRTSHYFRNQSEAAKVFRSLHNLLEHSALQNDCWSESLIIRESSFISND